MKDFWSKENFEKLKKVLYAKYHHELFSKALIDVCETSNSTSKEEIQNAGELVAKVLWKQYKEKHNIKLSKPKTRIEPIYYPNSTSVTADEYRYIKEDYYNEESNTVIVRSPERQAGVYVAREEEYIEIPEKFARSLLVLSSFKK